MAKSYATVADVEAILGRTLTPEQAAQATALLEAATAAFDGETGRSFADATPVVGEERRLVWPDLYLERAPVASVQRVRARAPSIGATAQDLVAGRDYDLVQPGEGRVRLTVATGTILTVDYTPALVPAPTDVGQATAQWATAWLTPTLSPGAQGVEQVSVGMGELVMRFRDPVASREDAAIPPSVEGVLARYRRLVFA